MNPEQKSNKVEVLSRIELHDAIAQYPNSLLLPQVEALSREAYATLYNVYNKGLFVFNDFGLFEEERGPESISALLLRLQNAESEDDRRGVAEQIAQTIVT